MRFWGLFSFLRHRHRWRPSEFDIRRGTSRGRWPATLGWFCESPSCRGHERTPRREAPGGWSSYASPDGRLTLIVDPSGLPYAHLPEERWVPAPG